MKKSLPYYASVGFMALAVFLPGCAPRSEVVSMRLTMSSAKNVRNGQYCETSLKTAFGDVFNSYMRKDNWDKIYSPYLKDNGNEAGYSAYLIQNVQIAEVNPENCPAAKVSLPGQASWAFTPSLYSPGINDATINKTSAALSVAMNSAFDSSGSGALLKAGVKETISIRIKQDDIVLVHRGMFCENDLAKAFDAAITKFKNGEEAIVDLNIPQNPLQNCQVKPKTQKLTG